MTRRDVAARLLAVSITGLSLAVVCSRPALALNPVVGTVQVNGPVWVSGDARSWNDVSLTRPMLIGDTFKTGEDGYLLADMGAQGVIGMYGNSLINAVGNGNVPQIDVAAGKVAFHLAATSELVVSVADAELIAPGPAAGSGVDAYVEINDNGDAVVSVEHGFLNVRTNGVERRVKAGERYLLKETALGARPEQLGARPEQLAAAETANEDLERDKAAGLVTEEDEDEEGAGVPPGGEGIGVGEAAVGVAVVGGGAAALSGGGGGDTNGSP